MRSWVPRTERDTIGGWQAGWEEWGGGRAGGLWCGEWEAPPHGPLRVKPCRLGRLEKRRLITIACRPRPSHNGQLCRHSAVTAPWLAAGDARDQTVTNRHSTVTNWDSVLAYRVTLPCYHQQTLHSGKGTGIQSCTEVIRLLYPGCFHRCPPGFIIASLLYRNLQLAQPETVSRRNYTYYKRTFSLKKCMGLKHAGATI